MGPNPLELDKMREASLESLALGDGSEFILMERIMIKKYMICRDDHPYREYFVNILSLAPRKPI